MTVYLKDRVKQITATTGTGTITFTSTPSGYQSFSSAYNDGDEVYYVIENKSDYEIGVGTYTANTLSRDTVLKSTNGGAKLSLTGRSTVFVSVPAEKTVYIDGTGQASINLDKLSDVIITAPASGEGLKYNGTNWVNGNISGYTDEQAQDAVAGMLIGATGINISYNDGSNTLTIAATGLLQSNLNLSDLTNAATARNNLGLGSAAVSNSGDFVPYIGATGVVNLGSQSLSAGAATFSGILQFPDGLENGTTPYLKGSGSSGFSTFGNTIQFTDHLGNKVFGGGNAYNERGFVVGPSAFLGFRLSGNILNGIQNSEVRMYADASAVLALRNTTNAQTLRVYGTYTDANTNEFIQIRGVAGANFEFGPSNGSIGGTLRGLTIGGYVNGSSTITPWLSFTNAGAATFVGAVNAGGDISIGSAFGPVLSTQGGFHSYLSAYRDVGGASLYLRSSTGGTDKVVTLSAGGLCVRNYADSADAALTAGAITASSVSSPILTAAAGQAIGLRAGASGSNHITVATTGTVTFANTIYAPAFYGLVMGNDVFFARDAASTLELRNSTTAITFALSNTYTSGTNFEQGKFQWVSNEWRIGTAVGSTGGTQRNLVLGSWASTSTWIPKVVITSSATGAFYLGGVADNTSTNGNARGQYAIDLQLSRNAATQVASDYGVCIGTQCTASGNNASVAIGRAVNVTDSIGGSVGIGKTITLSGFRAVGIGANCIAVGDGIAIGTAANAAHSGAICFTGANSLWTGTNTGTILWHASSNTEQMAGVAYNSGRIHGGGSETGTICVRTTSSTPTTLQSVSYAGHFNSTWRQRNKAILYEASFTVTALRSDGAAARFCRRVVVKSVADAAGSTYTCSVLQTDTIGTDVNEIAGASISITASSSQTLDISVTGEPNYACTGVSATNIITAVGHPFANNDIVVFTALTGGSSLSANPSGLYYLGNYKVINVSGNTFQLATPGSSTTPLALGSDISAGTVARAILWTKANSTFAVVASGY